MIKLTKKSLVVLVLKQDERESKITYQKESDCVGLEHSLGFQNGNAVSYNLKA